MRVLWTKKAIAGWREVADYILADFGAQAMQAFIERTEEAEGIISLLPNIGSVEWSDTQEGVVYKKLSTDNLKAVWPSGSGYDGEMKNGLMHGKGKKILPDGTIKEGTFENDKFVH